MLRRRRAKNRLSVEALEPRTLLSGSISGIVWNDANGDGVKQAAEAVLANRTVYLDQNRNRVRDAGESFTSTNATGAYTFTGLAAATYYVAEDLPVGWKQTSPSSAGALISATATDLDIPPITTTASNEPVYAESSPADSEVASLIHLDTYRSDPRFTSFDGRGYSVAVIDTGIDVDHPFFGPDADNNGVADRIVYQHDFADNDNDATDHDGHGSNVASIAAGGDSAGTYSGMAPGANIIALKVFSDAGAGSFSYTEKALQWVVANATAYNISSVNLSISDGMNWSSPETLYGISDELAALAAKNVVVFAADGNSFNRFDSARGVAYPAADPNAFAVGAVWDSDVGSTHFADGAIDFTTGPDRITSFTQRAFAMTDIMAPGGYSTGANAIGGTNSLAGTSQATPVLSGLAVIAQQIALQQIGRRLTTAEFRNVMVSSGRVIYDGDDEDDSVTNTTEQFKVVDALALAIAVLAKGPATPFEFRVVLDDQANITGKNFGNQLLNLKPDLPDLDGAFDTGFSTTDNVTRFDNSSAAQRLNFIVTNTQPTAVISLLADGVLIGTATASSSVTTVTTNGTFDLLEGTHSIVARQSLPGFADSDSLALSLKIDTIAPPPPAAPDLLAASDSGTNNADNITNAQSLGFAVSYSGGEYFQMSRSGNSLNSIYATGATFTTPAPSDGVHNYAVISLDAAGNSTPGPSINVTIDTVPWQPTGTTAPGQLDTSFGSGGVSILSKENAQMTNALLALPDGKSIVIGGTATYLTYPGTIVMARYLIDGSLDTTFGTDGWAYSTPPHEDECSGALLQPDGKIVVIGTSLVSAGFNSYYSRPLMLRFNADGSPDTTFGGGTGRFMPTLDAEWTSVAFAPGGGFYVAGSMYVSPYHQFAVAKILPNGSFDTSFDGDGVRTFDVGPGSDRAAAMTVQPDGKIVLAGSNVLNNGWKVALARIDINGTLDTTFNGGGAIEGTGVITFAADMSNGYRAGIYSIAIAKDGKIILGGSGYNANNGYDRALVMRLNSDGGFDSGFGSKGIMLPTWAATQHYGRVESILVQSDGKFLACGYVTGFSSSEYTIFAAERFTMTGSIDSSFGTGGIAKSPLMYYPKGVRGYAAAITFDNKLALAGYAWSLNTDYESRDAAMARFYLDSEIPAPDLIASSDSGISDTDNITSDSTPTLAGPTGTSGFFYRLYRSGTQISGAFETGGQNFTATFQNDGTQNYTLRVVDVAGNVTAMSRPLAVTVDTDNPGVVITPVAPDPRSTPVDAITITFDELIVGFTLLDLTLTRSGSAGSLTGATLQTIDNKVFTLGNLSSITTSPGTYELKLAAAAESDLAGNTTTGETSETWSNAIVQPNPEITGRIFNDTNSNGLPDASENGLANWTIFIDTNNNNVLDAGESSTISSASGDYSFKTLASGLYRVRIIVKNGYRKTRPSGTPGYDVQLNAGESATDINFGTTTNIYLAGRVFNDMNQNGTLDASETFMAGVVINIVSNQTTVATRTTDANGFWQVKGLAAGTGEAVVVLPIGSSATIPAAGKYSGSMSSGQQNGNLNFGLHSLGQESVIPAETIRTLRPIRIFEQANLIDGLL